MCLHMFAYYPRMKNLTFCLTRLTIDAWIGAMNRHVDKLSNTFTDFSLFSSSYSDEAVQSWLLGLTWTPESIIEWQKFYNTASRGLGFGRTDNFGQELLPQLPEYEDLKPPECTRIIMSSASHQNSVVLLVFISFIRIFFSN